MDSENDTQVAMEKTQIAAPPLLVTPPVIPSPEQVQPRRAGVSLFALVTIVVVGSMIGGVIGGMIVYLGRPYLDQQLGFVSSITGSGGQVSTQPVAVALETNTTSPTSTSNVANAATTTVSVETSESAIPAAPPALISPTPDRSGEINAFVISKTRHFTGNPEAKVTIIEFSDFQ